MAHYEQLDPVKLAGLIIAFVLAGAAPPAPAGERHALVIGNARYEHANALRNPVDDANAIARVLRALDFRVQVHRNLDRAGMLAALDVFAHQLGAEDLSLFFYAGHGMELEGVNYLVPTDARLDTREAVRAEAITLDRSIRAMHRAGGRILLIDACRNNPLVAHWRSDRRGFSGFAPVRPPPDTVVIFATLAGQLSVDGRGDNSPFSAALLRTLPEVERGIDVLFDEVQASVLAATSHAQQPDRYGELRGARALLQKDRPGRTRLSEEDRLWRQALRSGSRAALESYLSRFPRGAHAAEALRRLEAAQGPDDREEAPAGGTE